MYIYGTAPDFGATFPEKQADIVGVYNIYVPIWHCSRFWGNCSQKTGRYSGGLLHRYIHIYRFAPDFGAIVPKERADIVGVYYKYVHL